ncbi:MAG: type II secretion system protein [Clostridia bacterium]|nr:type II secretion system protein [Clostridia bacterium]
MKRANKKGFTIVELIIVIAVIAVLAAVLIPAFSNIINKANESAYDQDRRNQQTMDTIEKIDNPNYMTWEDFEAKFAEILSAVGSTPSADDIIAAVQEAIKTEYFEKGISDERIKDIIERTINGKYTDVQLKAVIEAALQESTMTEAEINNIVNKAVSKLDKRVGVSKEEMTAAITAAFAGVPNGDAIANMINAALEGFSPNLTEDDYQEIADAVIAHIGKPKAKVTDLSSPLECDPATFGIELPAELSGKKLVADISLQYEVIPTDIDADFVSANDHSNNGWFADYEVSFNNSVAANTVGLLGAYKDFGDGITVPLSMPALNSNTPQYLLKDYVFPMIFGGAHNAVNYSDVVNMGAFKCGAFNIGQSNHDNGTVITVRLCIYEGYDSSTNKYIGRRIEIEKRSWNMGESDINQDNVNLAPYFLAYFSEMIGG